MVAVVIEDVAGASQGQLDQKNSSEEWLSFYYEIQTLSERQRETESTEHQILVISHFFSSYPETQ